MPRALPPRPGYSIEKCREILSQDPVGCMAFYHKIQQQIQETEKMQSVTLSHADSVRAALEDGPKTYQGVAKWARENGNPAMDFPLANRICDRMVREGRVVLEEEGVYCLVTPGIIVPAEPIEAFPPTITLQTPAPDPVCEPEPPPPPSLKGPLYPPSGALIGEVDREAIAMACAPLPIGGSALFSGPKEDRAYDFGQVIRNTLNQRTYTKRWHWSVSIENNEERVIRVVKGRERDGYFDPAKGGELLRAAINADFKRMADANSDKSPRPAQPAPVAEPPILTPKTIIVKSAIPVGISMALIEIDAKIQDLEAIKRLIYCVYGNPV